MPIDPCFNELIANPKNHLRPPRPGAPLDSFRQALDAALAAEIGPGLHAVHELLATGQGLKVPVRLYRPEDKPALPVIMFCHGGGFVIGSLETHDSLCRRLAKASGAAVVAVEYRLAPEHPHPAGLQDCLCVLAWLKVHGAELGLQTARLAIFGDSAGAHLATETALAAGTLGCRPCHLGLLYPVVDPGCNTASIKQLGTGHLLTAEMMRWFWASYIGGHAGVNHDRFSLLGRDLSSIAAATIITAEYDPLRDEGEALAQQLRFARVPTTGRRYLGMIHGFGSLDALTPAADRAVSDVATDIRISLQTPIPA